MHDMGNCTCSMVDIGCSVDPPPDKVCFYPWLESLERESGQAPILFMFVCLCLCLRFLFIFHS